jgi:hypothetical protein
MSLTFVRTADPRQVLAALTAYYGASERPGPVEVADEAERRLVAWEDGYEPAPDTPLRLFVSPPLEGWIAVAFTGALTFDLPVTAWLADRLETETVAAYTWGDGYGLVTFDKNGVTWAEGHVRDEGSDRHLGQGLKSLGVPFRGDEDGPLSFNNVDPRGPGWLAAAAPPRPWPPLPSIKGSGDRSG